MPSTPVRGAAARDRVFVWSRGWLHLRPAGHRGCPRRAPRAETSQAPSAVALAEEPFRAPPPRVVAAEREGSGVLLSCNPGAAAIHVTPWSVQSQMEVAWQPLVGEAGGCSDLVAGSALSRARSVLMTPSATRATFERTTLETPTTGSPSSVGTSTSLRHVHWRNAVDAGDGWYCSNSQLPSASSSVQM